LFPQAKVELQQLVARVHSETTSHQQTAKTSCWNSCCTPRIVKPIIIVNVFNLLQIVCGTYLVIFYAVNLISDTQTDSGTIDPFVLAVLTALCRLIFITAACFLLFWVGRRPLAMFSGLGSSAAALGVGTFIYCRYPVSEPTDTWIVTGFILTYVATNTVGFFVLPGIAVGELLPVKVRGHFGGYIFAIFNIALFFMGKVFPSMLNVMGSYGAFWMFGASSLIGTLFLYLFFPETKGKTLEEIEDYFAESNVMWSTRKTQQSKNEPLTA
jgi:MFS family permease